MTNEKTGELNKVNIASLNYMFDNEGLVNGAQVTFQQFNSDSDFNVRVSINESDLTEGKTFEDVSPKQLQAIGRQKIAKWIML